MTAVAFDTHKFIKTLEAAGLPEQQAEAISSAVRESHNTADVATKRDLREYESVIKADFRELEVAIKVDLERLDTKIDKLETKLETRLRAMEARTDAKLEKLGLSLTVKLGSIVVMALGAFTVLTKWIS